MSDVGVCLPRRSVTVREVLSVEVCCVYYITRLTRLASSSTYIYILSSYTPTNRITVPITVLLYNEWSVALWCLVPIQGLNCTICIAGHFIMEFCWAQRKAIQRYLQFSTKHTKYCWLDLTAQIDITVIDTVLHCCKTAKVLYWSVVKITVNSVGCVARTSVFNRRAFPVLCSTCSWRLTIYVGKPSVEVSQLGAARQLALTRISAFLIRHVKTMRTFTLCTLPCVEEKKSKVKKS